MTKRRGWTRQQHAEWAWMFGLLGGGMALIWLGSDYWFFGLFSIVCLGFAYWAWIEAERVE